MIESTADRAWEASADAAAEAPLASAQSASVTVPTERVMPAWLAAHEVSVRGLSLDDVLGLTAAKQEIASLVARLRHPEVILAAGGELVQPFTDIGVPGFIALIRDTEGNVVGLHQPR